MGVSVFPEVVCVYSQPLSTWEGHGGGGTLHNAKTTAIDVDSVLMEVAEFN